jgi:hypothetical protein
MMYRGDYCVAHSWSAAHPNGPLTGAVWLFERHLNRGCGANLPITLIGHPLRS